MINREDILWEALRVEIELTLDSTNYEVTQDQLDKLTDTVINNDSLWQQFNETVLEIIDYELN